MRLRLEPFEERGEEERVDEPRVAAAPGCPRSEPPSLAASDQSVCDLDRAAHRRPSLRVCVQQESRPVGSRLRPRDEIGDGKRALGDQGLLLHRKSAPSRGVVRSVHDDAQAAFGDSRPYVDGNVERCRTQLLEPEAMLLDEIEGEAVAAWGTGSDHLHVELDLFARLYRPAKGRTNAVPDDWVPERVEPVVCDLNTLLPSGAPGRRAGVLEP